jgi:hypothetical protein
MMTESDQGLSEREDCCATCKPLFLNGMARIYLTFPTTSLVGDPETVQIIAILPSLRLRHP